MPGTFGKIEEFDLEKGDWNDYEDRLLQYFIANDVEDQGKQRAILLSVIGQAGYGLLRKLCVPEKPADKSFKDLCGLMARHQNPRPSVIMQRFRFNTRFQQPGESIAMYLAELRKLAEYCEYGTTLSEMLRDRLVCGTNNDQVQRRLLSERKLTYEKAREMAIAMETAVNDASTLKASQSAGGSSNAKEVFKVSTKAESCYRCLGDHSPDSCVAKTWKCYVCRQVGHVARACKSKPRENSGSQRKKMEKSKPKKKVYSLQKDESDDESGEDDVHQLYAIYKCNSVKPIMIEPVVEGSPLRMELDTGAAVSVVPQFVFEERLSHLVLKESSKKLKTYSGELLLPVGQVNVKVTMNGVSAELPLFVVQGNGPPLLGRNWLQALEVKLEVHQLQDADKALGNVLQKFSSVFKEDLGELQGTTAKIVVSEEKPRFFKARSLPFAMKDKVDMELTKLQQEGIIEAVKFSEWAAPVVPVQKPDGSVRLCGDYKLTINQASRLEQYPMPLVEDLFAILAGGEKFTKLDLKHAYLQVPLDENSKKYTTINTHRGLFQYNRLPFGISSAPAIFQRIMESLIQGIPGVAVYLDDIILTGRNDAEHLATMETVLNRLERAGLRLKLNKCQFLKSEVTYLGHCVSAAGLKPVPAKVKAVRDAPTPTNVSELKAFLGLLNYYGKFVPNLATVLEPLNLLLRKDTTWKWTNKQESAFQEVKDLLQTAPVLAHYDPSSPLVLACDASPYGVGAVLSTVIDGQEHPVGFVSRSLTKAEKGYSQLDKEALAIVFGTTKFHKYLYGRSFTLFTDHKPLLRLFGTKKSLPQMVSARLQRWALLMSAYEYEIKFKSGSENLNADALSRLPLPDMDFRKTAAVPEFISLLETMDEIFLTSNDIKIWTQRDPVLARVLKYVLSGWPGEVVEKELLPYLQRRDELSTLEGCLLWGNRVVVPPPAREKILEELHVGHPGRSRMKSYARGIAWWPGMDTDIERKVDQCTVCQMNRKMPAAAPLHPWPYPRKPWSRIHIDYAGPTEGKMFLVIIDSYSKWMDVYPVSSATGSQTVEKLRMCFATHGIPETIVSDNGSHFVNEVFSEFTRKNKITHIRISPYHPSSNGLAERAVQVFKKGLKMFQKGDIVTRLARFLISYRKTPQTSTGYSPAELLMHRKLRTRLDGIYPDPSNKVVKKQESLAGQQQAHPREFNNGDLVFVVLEGKLSSGKWLSGTVRDRKGPVTYVIELPDGRFVKRHVDHIRSRSCVSFSEPSSSPSMEITGDEPQDTDLPNSSQAVDAEIVPETPVSLARPPVPEILPIPDSGGLSVTARDSPAPTVRRSGRVSRPPDRLDL